MGDWTHVAGVIRMDKCNKPVDDWGIIIPGAYAPNYTDELVLDKDIVLAQDADRAHPWLYPEYNIPIEGEYDYEADEMQLRIYRDPWRNSALGYQLTITADMRSFASQMKILDWFGDICNRIDSSDYGYVRQASISIETESLVSIITATYQEDIFEEETYLLYTEYNRKTGIGISHRRLLHSREDKSSD